MLFSSPNITIFCNPKTREKRRFQEKPQEIKHGKKIFRASFPLSHRENPGNPQGFRPFHYYRGGSPHQHYRGGSPHHYYRPGFPTVSTRSKVLTQGLPESLCEWRAAGIFVVEKKTPEFVPVKRARILSGDFTRGRRSNHFCRGCSCDHFTPPRRLHERPYVRGLSSRYV